MTLALVLADTHIRDGAASRLPAGVVHLAERADIILHAGDVVGRRLLEELAAYAPVRAVLGNNDISLGSLLPETLTLDLDGIRVAMVHDSGPGAGRAGRMRRRFPDADLVVFGHSHIPMDIEGIDGQRLFNPGSPTQRRAQPHHTAGLLEAVDGRLVRHEIVRVVTRR